MLLKNDGIIFLMIVVHMILIIFDEIGLNDNYNLSSIGVIE